MDERADQWRGEGFDGNERTGAVSGEVFALSATAAPVITDLAVRRSQQSRSREIDATGSRRTATKRLTYRGDRFRHYFGGHETSGTRFCFRAAGTFPVT